MTTRGPTLDTRLAALRQAFDRSFAVPAAGFAAAGDGLLAVRVAGVAYALRLAEVAEIAAHKRVVALPMPRPSLLGITGLRGVLVAVYDLAALLGHAPLVPERPARVSERREVPWIVVTAGKRPIGLAIEAFEGQLRAEKGDFHAQGEGADTRFVLGVLMTSGKPRLVLDLEKALLELQTKNEGR